MNPTMTKSYYFHIAHLLSWIKDKPLLNTITFGFVNDRTEKQSPFVHSKYTGLNESV